jgi:selenide, water dikinase
VRNTGARPGDVLYLTKPLGVGVISTGAKQDRLPPGVLDQAVAQMRQLNREAAAAMVEVGVSAATDVSGFGLLGHLGELAAASGVSARLQSALVPLLNGALELAEAGVIPSGTRRNLAAAEEVTGFDNSISPAQRLLLADAQTSGGLLIAVAPGRSALLEGAMHSPQLRPARIGMIEAGEPGHLEVT